MRRDWWVSVLQWSLWGVVMVIVMGWVARSRLRARPEGDQRTLRHPISTLLIGLMGSAFFFGIAIISNTVGKNATATIWTTLGFVLFGLASLPMVADYFFARHTVSEAGLEYGRMWGQRGSLRWADVVRVSYASGMKWFVLQTRDGKTVRISVMLMGLPAFAGLLLQHVLPQAIDEEAFPIIRETQGGRPPSVWS